MCRMYCGVYRKWSVDSVFCGENWHQKLKDVSCCCRSICASINMWSSHINSTRSKSVENGGLSTRQKNKTEKASLLPKQSAPSAHLISALLLLSLPAVKTLRLLGMLLIPPWRFLSSPNAMGTLGAPFTLENYILLCCFASGCRDPKTGGGG